MRINGTLTPRTMGGKLKELRENKGWLQSDVASKIGIGQNTYSKYELDKMIKPVPEIIEKLADLYEVTIQYLIQQYDPYEHVPASVMKMVADPGAITFLMKAFAEYREFKKIKDAVDET